MRIWRHQLILSFEYRLKRLKRVVPSSYVVCEFLFQFMVLLDYDQSLSSPRVASISLRCEQQAFVSLICIILTKFRARRISRTKTDHSWSLGLIGGKTRRGVIVQCVGRWILDTAAQGVRPSWEPCVVFLVNKLYFPALSPHPGRGTVKTLL